MNESSPSPVPSARSSDHHAADTAAARPNVLRCGACGGTVAFQIGQGLAACIFCGSPALKPETDTRPDTELSPRRSVPFDVCHADADRVYREAARSSWFRPAALRAAQVEMRSIFVPAWLVGARVETHLTGLVSAASPSGKAPVAVRDVQPLDELIPASGALDIPELAALRPFRIERATPWDAEDASHPFELPGCSEERARARAHARMAARHAASIAQARDISRPQSSSILLDSNAELVMLPVHICAIRFRDRSWRFLVNASTGELVGKLPWDRVKIAGVVAAALAVCVALSIIVNA